MLAGLISVLVAKSRMNLSRRLAVFPFVFAALFVAWQVVRTMSYITVIPLVTQSDHARLCGYLTATLYFVAIFVTPALGVGLAALALAAGPPTIAEPRHRPTRTARALFSVWVGLLVLGWAAIQVSRPR
jgi:hypothetical protein